MPTFAEMMLRKTHRLPFPPGLLKKKKRKSKPVKAKDRKRIAKRKSKKLT